MGKQPGFKPTQYMRQEKAVVAADAGGIRERWFWGLRLLRDQFAQSPGGGGLRHGIAQQLSDEATAKGFKLSEREIRYRLQAARAYPTEAQIGSAAADFRTWRELCDAGFPAIAAPADEPLADHRTKDERDRDAARALLDLIGEQGTLFPLDQFEPAMATLKELSDYVTEQEELTARFAAKGARRREYLEAMMAAAGGDCSVTWLDAHRIAFPQDSP